ncbi:hypothetical protein [Budvicia aquatica]|nr:hypothetical protein [Budvicia aquatica]VFS46465.1 Uncharacterised protein [Budvicia aquatica]
MTGETVFWNISFSDKSIVDIETIINNVIDKKFSHIYSPLKLLMLAFDKKNSESEMLLSFLYRIATNIEFCIDEGISSKTHEYINLCIDGVQKEDIDLLSFYGLWEKSNCQWDVSLKSLTPDQPNYLADVFISIYQSDIILPSVFHLLGEISEISEKNICLSEVKNAMLNYYSDNTGVNEAVKLLPITT